MADSVSTSTDLVQASHVKSYVDERMVIPIDEDSLTPSSTFVKGNVVGINGVLYYCTADTSNFPVTLYTQGNAFVYNEAGGHMCFIVTDSTIQTGWVKWCDESVEYWLSFKQDKLTFDTTPTANSTNPVTSGGIYTQIAAINSQLAGVETLLAAI